MKANYRMPALLAVAALAYAGGRLGTRSGVQARQPQPEPGPAMQAYRDAAAPGERHRRLDPLAGTWTGRYTITMDPESPPRESAAKVRREWILGGRFLQETVVAAGDGGSFNGLGYIGYNNSDGEYQMVWMDDMSTAIYTETGTYHDDTRILHTRGSHRDPATGHMVHTWAKLDMSDPDRHAFTGWAVGTDGRVFKAFEAVLERAE